MKLLKYGYIFIFILCGLAIPKINAQKTLKGKVLEPESHIGHNHAPGEHQGDEKYNPIVGASVIWKGKGIGTTTDRFGFFKIPILKKGDTLQVSMIGYETVGILYTDQTYIEIPLQQGVQLDAVQVETRKAATSISILDPLIVQSLSRQELCKAACCNLSEAFETNAVSYTHLTLPTIYSV